MVYLPWNFHTSDESRDCSGRRTQGSPRDLILILTYFLLTQQTEDVSGRHTCPGLSSEPRIRPYLAESKSQGSCEVSTILLGFVYKHRCVMSTLIPPWFFFFLTGFGGLSWGLHPGLRSWTRSSPETAVLVRTLSSHPKALILLTTSLFKPPRCHCRPTLGWRRIRSRWVRSHKPRNHWTSRFTDLSKLLSSGD